MVLRSLRTFTFCTAAILSPIALLAQQPAETTPAAAGAPSPDKMFLHKASIGGYAEIQLGQLAAQKGNSDEVKKFGQKMVDDHTALNDQLKPFAEAMGLKAPKRLSPKDQAEYDKLNGLSGDAFDKEYLAYMVKDHHMDLRDFTKEEATAGNAALKDAVTKGTVVIREHTEMVDKMAKDMGVPVPANHRDAATPAGQ